MTQSDAKRFFVNSVMRQAAVENVRLSDAERQMMFWSESDPDFTPDAGLVEALAAEISDDEFEKKVSGLLRRAFEANVATNENSRDSWRDAKAALEQGDHYISIMIDQAVGSRLKEWWQLWR